MSQSNEKRIQYVISAKDDGLPGVKALLDGLDAATLEAAGLKDQAVEVAAALRNVGQQQAAIDNLRQLGSEGRTLSNQLNQATAELERLNTAKTAAAAKTAALADAERQAAAELATARADVQAMQHALKSLQSGSEQAARGTDEYKTSVAQARSSIAELRQQLQAKQGALSQAQAATKAAASEERALGNEYGAAVSAARKASEAVGEHRKAMDSARDAARTLGVDTSNLVSENERLKTAAQDAQKGLDALAAGAEKVRQRQAEADQVLKEFQANLRKLTTEGPEAPAGLEDAFKRLGLNGVKKAESAVHELQVALAQIRNSADVLPKDKEAAVAAFNKRVVELKAEARGAATSTDLLAQSTDGVGKAMGNAAHKAVAWTTALVGLNELKNLAGDVIATGSAFENLEVRLGNLLGGTEAATEAMGMIKELAATTPFAVTDMADAFVKLTAFGLQPTEAQMRSLADVAANLGGGTETLAGVTTALGQAWTKGKLQGEELMQLAERGVPVWDALATATGRSVPELQKMSAAGELGRDVISKLIDELGRMNEGASEQLMNTYAGAVSNAKDAMEEFFGMISKAGVLDWLTEKIRELLTEFERMKETGELERKAQDIADAFVAVAEMAEAVTRTLITMAPAIELAVKAWLGFKAINIASTLYTAAAAMTATAVGAQGAATGMTVAAGAATALSVAIKRLLAATGVGLLLVAIGEIGVRLMGVGDEAQKAGDDVEEGLGRAEAASNRAGDAAKAASKEQARLAREASAAAEERAKASAEAASAEVKAIEAVATTRKTDAAVTLQDLETRRLLASQSEEMAKLIGDEAGAIQARVALMEIDIAISEAKIAVQRIEAENTIAVAQAKLAEAQVTDTLNPVKEAELQGSIRLAEAKLKETDVQTAGLTLLQKSLEKTQEAIRSGAGYKEVIDGAANANKRLGEAAEEAGVKVEGVGRKSWQAGSETEQAFKRAGVAMQKDLDAAAEQSARDFELIKNSGEATAAGIAQAWRRMAEAQIAANSGVAIDAMKAEAAMYGLRIEVDETGRAIVKNMNDGKTAVEGFAKGVANAAAQLQRLKDLQGFAGAGGDLSGVSTEDLKQAQEDLLKEGGALSSPEYIKLRNELMGRGAPKTDANGFALDKSGNTLAMGGELTTLTGIANFLKQAGLSDEEAKSVAREFSDGKGNIPYFSNPGQMKYGGQSSTISEALLRAAERTTFGLGSNGASAIGVQKAGGSGQLIEPSSSHHVVEFRTEGRSRSFEAASADDASLAAAIIRELGIAQSRYS
ncbi:MAG: tape measure protein [Hydrogenophaga sp.]|uniref:tape measure protein n=1 Tax=Hydrogenophaga sp. TaxID=1904254 RepID=UPI0027181A9C|nr:tape measure protein [Hydrogenophaga sp.]MDO9568077.1 tape measure protein [Hydrogenophaga sp.]